ncbi:MAG: hypothetical protein KVP17_000856 [Porospora cf. gigantea B]|nr:MAG: hypothetical protein KVP17_000856 [Porospora cf. gigantea B]
MLPAVALTVLPVSLVLCTFFGGVISLVATSKITIKSCFLVTAVGNSLMTLLGSILEFDNPKQYALFVYTMYHL